jgi:dephospho-CoA kinase
MLKVGLTGNIGSGKSMISRIFGILGVPVYNADAEAKVILDSVGMKPVLVENFGIEIIGPDSKIDKRKMADIVFNDPVKLSVLNELVHPRVIESFGKWCLNYATFPYIIIESAILVESGLNRIFDRIITVSCPEKIRIRRVMDRDHLKKNEVIARMNNQLKEKEKLQLSDYIIKNNDKNLVIPQVLQIHRTLSK